MSQSITDWFALTKTGGEKGWKDFYKRFLNQPISQPDKFFKAVDQFGHKVMFEAVIAASTKTFSEDCLSYVMAVAVRMIQNDIDEIDEEQRYKMNLERAKLRTQMQNDELAQRMESIRHGQGTG